MGRAYAAARGRATRGSQPACPGRPDRAAGQPPWGGRGSGRQAGAGGGSVRAARDEHPARPGAGRAGTRSLLRAHGLHARKALSQSFLADAHIAERCAEAATTPAGGTVLEIGAGLGALTRPLCRRAARVIALERDGRLAAVLRETLAAEACLSVVAVDALRFDWAGALASGPRPRVVAGNVPYAISGRLIERTIGLCAEIDRAVFMLQREVVDRLCASPGSRIYGAPSVFAQAAFAVRRLLRVRPGAFTPVPAVESAVVVLEPLRPPRAAETEAFRAVVRAAFATRRKTLRNAWAGLGGWTRDELAARAARAGIALGARAETLSVEAFARMAAELEGGIGSWRPS
ncbi:MAG: ribosomal RNA small subunit methyltransferase A [Deltaproteobacteria bacterium]|nr:ribosomal RNA small subunit methyltransferase A [Deltaproteobacteria bacterium]